MDKPLQSFSRRLTRKIVLVVLAIMAVISLAAFAVTVWGMYASARDHYEATIGNMSRSIAAVLGKVEVSAANIADEVSKHLDSPEDVSEALRREVAVNSNLTGCGVGFVPDFFPELGRWFEPYAMMTDSVSTVRSIGSAVHDYHGYDWFASALGAEAGTWSSPYVDKEGAGALLCTYSIPIRQDGRTVAVCGADLSLVWLSDMLGEIDAQENEAALGRNATGIARHGIYSFILAPNGEYIAHPERGRVVDEESFFDYAPQRGAKRYDALGRAMCGGKTGDQVVTRDGRRYDVFYAPLANTGWSMGVAVPLRNLLAPALTFGGASLLLMLLGLLVIAEFSHGTIKKFTRPLVHLAGSAGQIAQGKFDTPLPEIKYDDELKLLRDAFDDMQHSLSGYIDELTEATAQKASIESELQVARNIQMAMLPSEMHRLPGDGRIDIHGSLAPAKAVGGDLYDFRLRKSDGKLCFCIGDVAGKGVPAALMMSVTSYMFRTLSESTDGPDRLVSRMNGPLSERNENMMFVTFFAGEIDPATGELAYCNAGHNAPVVIEDGRPRFLEADPNMPLGVMKESEFTLQRTVLRPGAVLFMYTDGLTEATRRDGTLFGEDRMMASLSAMDPASGPEDIVSRMAEDVHAFVAGAEPSDDLTMLAVRTMHQ